MTGVSYLSTWRAAESGGYNCDYADLEEIAENFSSLLLDLVEQALELGNLCKEL